MQSSPSFFFPFPLLTTSKMERLVKNLRINSLGTLMQKDSSVLPLALSQSEIHGSVDVCLFKWERARSTARRSSEDGPSIPSPPPPSREEGNHLAAPSKLAKDDEMRRWASEASECRRCTAQEESARDR